MAMELNAKSWKKHKALTLMNEPLTKLLDAYDKAEAELANTKTGFSREAAARVTGALKLVLNGITETEKKCNKKLHKETLEHLKTLAILANARIKIVDQMKGQHEKFLQKMKTLVQETVRLATEVEKAQRPELMKQCQASAKGLQDFYQSDPCSASYQIVGVEKYAMGIQGNCKDLMDEMEVKKKADPHSIMRLGPTARETGIRKNLAENRSKLAGLFS
jgi:uncharacterized protein YnzC (UPF0291/DUF896 family)